MRKLLGIVMGLFVMATAVGAFAQSDVIKKRQGFMKASNGLLKAMRKASKSNDFATVEAKATEIAANFKTVKDLFPKGIMSEKSRAKAEIWEKWDQFNAKVMIMTKGAEELAQAAQAKDGEKVGTLLKAFYRTKCNSCHRSFRARKKKK